MTNQVCFPKGAKVTLADGSYKNIEDIVEGDEVQTYDMSSEDFDSASIHQNKQTTTKVDVVKDGTEKSKNMIRIKLEQYIDEDLYTTEELEEIKTDLNFDELVMNKYTAVMGGDDKGWIVHDRDNLVLLLNEETTEGEEEHDFSDVYSQIEVDSTVSADSDKNLKELKVTSIDKTDTEDEEVKVYSILSLEAGDCIFVNDVLVKVHNSNQA
tara:strand:- start:30 stop:662 length:633 start_codon:yes stop_codon:yes gene_type:complete